MKSSFNFTLCFALLFTVKAAGKLKQYSRRIVFYVLWTISNKYISLIIKDLDDVELLSLMVLFFKKDKKVYKREFYCLSRSLGHWRRWSEY